MKFLVHLILLLILSLGLIFWSCDREKNIIPPNGGESNTEKIDKLKTILSEVPEPDQPNYDNSSSYYELGENYYYKLTTVDVAKDPSEFNMFDTDVSNAIYPGVLLKGNSLRGDVFPSSSSLNQNRGHGRIIINLYDGGISYLDVPHISKSNVRQAINDLIGSERMVPAIFAYDEVHIDRQHEESYAIALSTKIKFLRSKVNTTLNFSREYHYNRFLVKLYQEYYTIEYEAPGRFSGFFDTLAVTDVEIKKVIESDGSLAYVESVTYGRVFMMLIESTTDVELMRGHVNAAFKILGINGSGSVDWTQLDALENLTIKVYAYGGVSTPTLQGSIVSRDSINQYLVKADNILANVPLSFKVQCVKADVEVEADVKVQYTENDSVDYPTDGLMVYLPLNGDAYDEINQTNGKVYGAFDDADQLGRVSSAMNFDGLNDYIQTTVPENTFAGDFTVTTWFKRGNQNEPCPIITNHIREDRDVPVLGFTPSNLLGLHRTWVDWNQGCFVDIGSHSGQWVFTALIRDGNYLKVYAKKDDQMFFNASYLSWQMNHTNNIYIAGAGSGGFRGLIDNIRLYNRALNDREIQNLAKIYD